MGGARPKAPAWVPAGDRRNYLDLVRCYGAEYARKAIEERIARRAELARRA